MLSVIDPFLAAARAEPNALAWSHGGRKVLYGELVERVRTQAGALRATGTGVGDRVAILSPNSPEMLEAYLAIAWAGAVAVPINTRLAAAEIAAQVADSEATTLLFHGTLASHTAEVAETVRRVAIDGENSLSSMDGDAIACAATVGEANAYIFYTGGTTGRAKGVVLSHRAAIVNALNFQSAVCLPRHSVWLHVAPMFHLADMTGFLPVAMTRSAQTFLPAFSPAAMMEAIATHRATHCVCVPTMINALICDPEFDAARLASLKQLLYGGSAISPALLERVLGALPDVGLLQAYGQSEAGPLLTILPPERHVMSGRLAGKLASAGRAVPGVELSIVDPATGQHLARGETGEIWARGLNTMSCYWRQPEATAEALRDGWLRTGDMGRLDEDDFLFVADRLKDMIVSGGENIFSAEVEAALASHPAVLECAVIGVPDDKWGERVHAIVRFAAGASATEDELVEFCRKQIARYKAPRSIEVYGEPLPLSGAGKILKTALRAPHWANRDRAVN
jgi:long-chain acyl-CoA synthetase